MVYVLERPVCEDNAAAHQRNSYSKGSKFSFTIAALEGKKKRSNYYWGSLWGQIKQGIQLRLLLISGSVLGKD